jgi:hypothetical protein
LRAPGTIHIRVIGINVAAFLAPENSVLTGRRLETPPPKLRIDAHGDEAREQNHHVEQNQVRDGHFYQAPNSKSQTPKKHQAPKTKIQRSSKQQTSSFKPANARQQNWSLELDVSLELGAWFLELLPSASLEFGVWDLEFFLTAY